MNLNQNKKIFITGSDFFLESELKRVLGSIDDCETEQYISDDFTEENFFSFINSPSMFQDNKAAVIKSAEKIKGLPVFISKCANCIETNLIFLSAPSKADKELSAALKEGGFEQITEKKATKYDMTGQILKMFADKDFRIDSASAMEINEIFEGDLKQVSNELEKLEIYFAYKKPKSPSDIINAITTRKQDTIFQFIDSFSTRRRKDCVLLLDSFLSSGENLAILINLLFRRMKDVYFIENSRELVAEKRPWLLDKVKAGGRVWKKSDMVKLFGLFAELDYMNKTGRIGHRDYLLRLISVL